MIEICYRPATTKKNRLVPCLTKPIMLIFFHIHRFPNFEQDHPY